MWQILVQVANSVPTLAVLGTNHRGYHSWLLSCLSSVFLECWKRVQTATHPALYRHASPRVIMQNTVRLISGMFSELIQIRCHSLESLQALVYCPFRPSMLNAFARSGWYSLVRSRPHLDLLGISSLSSLVYGHFGRLAQKCPVFITFGYVWR